MKQHNHFPFPPYCSPATAIAASGTGFHEDGTALDNAATEWRPASGGVAEGPSPPGRVWLWFVLDNPNTNPNSAWTAQPLKGCPPPGTPQIAQAPQVAWHSSSLPSCWHLAGHSPAEEEFRSRPNGRSYPSWWHPADNARDNSPAKEKEACRSRPGCLFYPSCWHPTDHSLPKEKGACRSRPNGRSRPSCWRPVESPEVLGKLYRANYYAQVPSSKASILII